MVTMDGFQSTLPVWGATRWTGLTVTFSAQFQSTLPVWGATLHLIVRHVREKFQSTLPVWGATLDSSVFRAGS